MINIIYIAAGGALGAVIRYLVSPGIHSVLCRRFPYGTLTVNVVGSFIMVFLFIFMF